MGRFARGRKASFAKRRQNLNGRVSIFSGAETRDLMIALAGLALFTGMTCGLIWSGRLWVAARRGSP